MWVLAIRTLMQRSQKILFKSTPSSELLLTETLMGEMKPVVTKKSEIENPDNSEFKAIYAILRQSGTSCMASKTNVSVKYTRTIVTLATETLIKEINPAVTEEVVSGYWEESHKHFPLTCDNKMFDWQQGLAKDFQINRLKQNWSFWLRAW